MESPLQALLREVEAQLAHAAEAGELAQAAGSALLAAPSAAAVLEILLQPGVQVRAATAAVAAAAGRRFCPAFLSTPIMSQHPCHFCRDVCRMRITWHPAKKGARQPSGAASSAKRWVGLTFERSHSCIQLLSHLACHVGHIAMHAEAMSSADCLATYFQYLLVLKPQVRLFSEALRYCDESSAEGGPLAARLYCNRALALTKLHAEGGRGAAGGSDSGGGSRTLLEGALQDSSAAIECDPLFAKAHYRRAWVLRALGRGAAALPDAQRAVLLLQEQQAGGSGEAAEAAALAAELQAAVAAETGGEAALAGSQANGIAAAPAAAAAAQDVDSLVRLAGPQLAVQQTEDAGRCLLAAAALPAAADVLQEVPFAHALTKAGRRSVGEDAGRPWCGL